MDCVEFVITEEEGEGESWEWTTDVAKKGSKAGEYSLELPCYVFCVDLTGGRDYLELVKSALQAALEALTPETWVGLAVFSGQLGLYNMYTRQAIY